MQLFTQSSILDVSENVGETMRVKQWYEGQFNLYTPI